MSIWAAISILGLLGLFSALSIWIQRRFSQPTGRGDITIESQRRLGTQNTVSVIAVDGRRFLVASSKEGARLLSELDPTQPVAEDTP